MTFDDFTLIVDKVLLTNVGREEAGDKVCGLKDVCDILKNLLLIASLLFASLSLTLKVSSQKHPSIAVQLYWIGLVGILPLLGLLVLLVRQTFLATSKLPVFGAVASTSGRIVATASVILGLCGIAAGMLGLVVAAFDKL